MLSNREPEQLELFPIEQIDLQPVGASSRQVGGDHYRVMPIQPWDFLKSCLTEEEFRGYMKGNAIVYLAREKAKGGAEDIAKAQHYLDKLMEEV